MFLVVAGIRRIVLWGVGSCGNHWSRGLRGFSDFPTRNSHHPRDRSCESASCVASLPVHLCACGWPPSPLAGCGPAGGAARVSKEPPAPWSPETFVLRRSQNQLLFSSNVFTEPRLDRGLDRGVPTVHLTCGYGMDPILISAPQLELCPSIFLVSLRPAACISPARSSPPPRS